VPKKRDKDAQTPLELYGLPAERLEDVRYGYTFDGKEMLRQVGASLVLDERRGWATVLHVVQRRSRGWDPPRLCLARWEFKQGRWRIFAHFWIGKPIVLHALAGAARLVSTAMRQIERTQCGFSPPTSSSRRSSTARTRT
jgi:hypothetical protein